MGFGYKNKRVRKKAISAINVTPFVDIILVLLIIFMITSPMLDNGYEVNLPKASSSKINTTKKDQIIFSVDKNGNARIGESLVNKEKIINYLASYKPQNTEIFIKGDKGADYGKVIDLMGTIHDNGFNNISLVTDKL